MASELPRFGAGSATPERPDGTADADELQRRGISLEIRRVLVVDDEPSVLRAIRRLFSAISVEVLSTTDGDRAVEIARELAPQLALVDVCLQRGNPSSGLRVISNLRATNHDVRIGAISGAMSDELRASCIAAGASWTLAKPFNRAQLLEAMIVGGPPSPAIMRTDLPLRTVKHLYVERVLEAQGGSKSATARVLQTSRSSVQRIVKRIEHEDDDDSDEE